MLPKVYPEMEVGVVEMVEVLGTAEALEMLEIVEERMGVDEVVGMVGMEETEEMVEVVTNWKVMMQQRYLPPFLVLT